MMSIADKQCGAVALLRRVSICTRLREAVTRASIHRSMRAQMVGQAVQMENCESKFSKDVICNAKISSDKGAANAAISLSGVRFVLKPASI
jgi:hypothetical protein